MLKATPGLGRIRIQLADNLKCDRKMKKTKRTRQRVKFADQVNGLVTRHNIYCCIGHVHKTFGGEPGMKGFELT